MAVLLILLAISAAAQWYARQVTLPRYCQYPADTLDRVRELLSEQQVVNRENRKPYIIAARLTFLVPRNNSESIEAYISRLQQHIDLNCH